jgi:hypothetical protein
MKLRIVSPADGLAAHGPLFIMTAAGMSDDARFNIALLIAHKLAIDEQMTSLAFKSVLDDHFHKAILLSATFSISYHGLAAAQLDDAKPLKCLAQSPSNCCCHECHSYCPCSR